MALFVIPGEGALEAGAGGVLAQVQVFVMARVMELTKPAEGYDSDERWIRPYLDGIDRDGNETAIPSIAPLGMRGREGEAPGGLTS